MRHIIDAIAAQGRNGDDDLLHVTKGEMAGLDALARRYLGRELPRNPRTGLKEASLFRDWFGNDVGMALDIAAPVATAFIPGVGPVAAAAMGAGLGAANQGLGKGGTTESALMGGVMGGIGAYGGSGLAEGLGAVGTTAAPTGVTAGVTPIGEASTNLGVGSFTDVAANLPGSAATPAVDVAASTAPTTTAVDASSNLAQLSGQGQTQAQTAMQGMPNLTQGTPTPQGVNMPGASTPPPVTQNAGLKWDYLASKDALSPMTQIGTSALGTSQIPSGLTTSSVTGTDETDEKLPNAEVYYTPYGERRTRIVGAASGGLMGFADYDAADAEADGGYSPGGPVQNFDIGGIAAIRALQPGGKWGDVTAQAYGAQEKLKPQWLQDAEPGGFVGAMVPGKMDYEDQQRQKQEDAANQAAAEEKAKKEKAAQAAFNQQWQDRYKQQFAQGGIASFGAGRYLQGPGDGMSDSIKANIDGKQEARLATGEFVVPADVVSHLGNGDSTAGAKQLHSMMDRARMSRTGTKTQGKQINPRKVMPV